MLTLPSRIPGCNGTSSPSSSLSPFSDPLI
jgi:hypothetical protein